jgi:hypothetical protein
MLIFTTIFTTMHKMLILNQWSMHLGARDQRPFDEVTTIFGFADLRLILDLLTCVSFDTVCADGHDYSKHMDMELLALRHLSSVYGVKP